MKRSPAPRRSRRTEHRPLRTPLSRRPAAKGTVIAPSDSSLPIESDSHTSAIDLAVSIASLRLKNPVMVASGTFGGIYGEATDASVLGAIVLKTVTLHPRGGNPPPRIYETASGAINSIGLENKGLERFLAEDLPNASRYGTKIIASISAKNVEEYALVAEKIDRQGGADALELNISCPNVSEGLDFGTDPELAERVVRAVKKVARAPVIVKLTPNVTDIVKVARGAERGGADALSLINTVKALAVDWRRGVSRLGGITGGLSGPAIKPIALRMVREVASAVALPVIGIGGIGSAEDVMEFLCVGATAVQVGTANFTEPRAAETIVGALPRLIAASGRTSLKECIGSFRG